MRGELGLSHKSVYPRVCGVGGTLHAVNGYALGLSPRVRGGMKQYLPDGVKLGLSLRVRGGSSRRGRVRLEGRFIPACAGWVCRARAGGMRTGGYPRVCGVGSSIHAIAMKTPGLSPRVRGGLSDARPTGRRDGFIPACAGWVGCTSIPASPARVYPRVCGVGDGELI